MSNKLLIVESPAKAKTIGKYLGEEFTVKSSVGHVRDLPKKGLSIKIAAAAPGSADWIFTPSYEVPPDKKKVVDELRKAAKAADEIYLAPDPDREGEAIAWHLGEVLADVTKGKPVHRVTYNEITKGAVLAAVANPGEINLARVDAQQARRILDRLVGFKVSPLLWKNLQYGYSLSAGRVQSVALRLLVEREREINAFKPVSYWVMGVEASKGTKETTFVAKLARLDGEKPDIKTQEQSATCVDDLDGSMLRVASVKMLPKTRHPYPPFTTSTLQQAASSVCGFSPHRTMSIAQKLYEAGLITYMRTDSVNVAQVALQAVRQEIGGLFGDAYVPEKPNFYKSKAGAQEAHEAIRPTDVSKKPSDIALDATSAKLYDLIWRRFMASQMADAKLMQKTVGLEAEKDGLRHSYLFTASTTAVEFEGFLAVTKLTLSKKTKGEEEEESDEVKSLPPLNEGEMLQANRWLSERKETKPPARFSEASLVKALEENGVGRPSTYAQTIEVLVDRQYATREQRQLVPSQRGMDVNDWLVKKLEPLFNVGYTAEMEADLDKVEEGAVKGDGMLSEFYRKFSAWMEAAKEPPPPVDKFDQLFRFLAEVKEWKPPVKIANRLHSDQGFVDSLRQQLAEKKLAPSDRQLQALAKIAIAYREQVPDGEIRLIDMGYGSELDRVKNAPSDELVKWCFQTIDRIGGLQKNPFLNSLREQVDRGRLLSQKQFQILARSVGENSGALEDADQVRARLAPYVPDGFEVAPVDPAVPDLLKLLESVTTWKEPVRRGRRTYNDAEFVSSLRDQYARRSSLSPRQVLALRRVCVNYREQIPTFEEVADRLGLRELPRAEKTVDAERDAKRAARGERKTKKARGE
ncbi:MAG: type I DNA topoisomerase [Kiritimatiellae bacterium]|nr:type I DNA topoisomerase [Kiritimatiellia bacterium]